MGRTVITTVLQRERTSGTELAPLSLAKLFCFAFPRPRKARNDTSSGQSIAAIQLPIETRSLAIALAPQIRTMRGGSIAPRTLKQAVVGDMAAASCLGL